MSLLIILSILFLNFFLVPDNDKTFEGLVFFKLEYSNIHERLPNDYLCSMSGDSMTYHHSDEGYLQEFYCREELIQRRWFDSKDNSLSMLNESDDTLFYYYAHETDFTAKLVKTETIETIIGYDCTKFTLTLIPKDGIDLPIANYDFFITNDLTINPEPFNRYTEGGFSQLMSELPGLILKQTYYGPYYTKTRTAVTLKRKKVNLEKHKPTRILIKKRI